MFGYELSDISLAVGSALGIMWFFWRLKTIYSGSK